MSRFGRVLGTVFATMMALAAVSESVSGQAGQASDPERHWLVGLCEGRLEGNPATPGPRLIRVLAVAADGTAKGTMGVADGWPGKAEIQIEGPRVHIVNAAKSVIHLTRQGDDELVGVLTSSAGNRFSVTFVRQTIQREQAYADSFKNDVALLKCTESGSLAATSTSGPPQYCAGDTWEYSNGRVVSVVSTDRGEVVMSGGPCGGCLRHYDRNLRLQQIEHRDGRLEDPASMKVWEGPDFKFWDFPLEVKKSWYFSAKRAGNDGYVHYVEVTVTGEALEDVKTRAGTFKAFRIRQDWKSAWVTYTAFPNVFSRTVWFAPAVSFPTR